MHDAMALQQWLHQGMARGLGDVAGGNPWAIIAAMGAAMMFPAWCTR